jgi:hypothetical protein
MSDLSTYNKLLQFIKSTIKQGQYLAYSKVNTVLIGTYFEIGKIIIEKKIIE